MITYFVMFCAIEVQKLAVYLELVNLFKYVSIHRSFSRNRGFVGNFLDIPPQEKSNGVISVDNGGDGIGPPVGKVHV